MFLYRRYDKFSVTSRNSFSSPLFTKEEGLPRVLALYKSFSSGSLSAVNMRLGFLPPIQALFLTSWPLGHDSAGSILDVLGLSSQFPASEEFQCVIISDISMCFRRRSTFGLSHSSAIIVYLFFP